MRVIVCKQQHQIANNMRGRPFLFFFLHMALVTVLLDNVYGQGKYAITLFKFYSTINIKNNPNIFF